MENPNSLRSTGKELADLVVPWKLAEKFENSALEIDPKNKELAIGAYLIGYISSLIADGLIAYGGYKILDSFMN